MHTKQEPPPSPSDHVLVGTANVSGDNLHDDAVVAFALLALGGHGAGGGVELQLGKGDVLDLRGWRDDGGTAAAVGGGGDGWDDEQRELVSDLFFRRQHF